MMCIHQLRLRRFPNRLFSALAITNGWVVNPALGILDVSDAFLQVPQQHPRWVTLGNQSFLMLRCLPGQRDASKLWYRYFTSKLQPAVGAIICAEQPCILKCGPDGALLIHVDDIMFIGPEEWVTTKLIPGLTAEFKLNHCYVKRHEGCSFEFLKRVHVVEPGYSSITIYADPKLVHSMIGKYTEANWYCQTIQLSQLVSWQTWFHLRKRLPPARLVMWQWIICLILLFISKIPVCKIFLIIHLVGILIHFHINMQIIFVTHTSVSLQESSI